MPICLKRGPVVQLRVRAPGVVKRDPVFEPLTDLAAGFEGVQIDAFIFQGSPQPFNHDVVPTAPLAVHGDANVRLFKDVGELIAGELAALVGVENLGFAKAGQGLFERIHAEIGVHGVG